MVRSGIPVYDPTVFHKLYGSDEEKFWIKFLLSFLGQLVPFLEPSVVFPPGVVAALQVSLPSAEVYVPSP